MNDTGFDSRTKAGQDAQMGSKLKSQLNLGKRYWERSVF